MYYLVSNAPLAVLLKFDKSKLVRVRSAGAVKLDVDSSTMLFSTHNNARSILENYRPLKRFPGYDPHNSRRSETLYWHTYTQSRSISNTTT